MDNKISRKEKIDNEISIMPNDHRKIFRNALNKYSFDFEVFIPSSLRITKNEYKDKDYLINNLVTFENKLKERKQFVNPLKKETKRFSRQYKLIKEENYEKQREYLENLENLYAKIGYNSSTIKYKTTDNIFSPSSLLEQDFGINIQSDAYKYSNQEYKKDYNKDQILIKKWKHGIKDVKDKKMVSVKKDEKNEQKNNEEESKEKEEFRKELEKIKNKMLEEERIKNMSKKEYREYSGQLKNDIKKVKESLNEFKYKQLINNLTYKIMNASNKKNYKEKIVFASPQPRKENTNRILKTESNKETIKRKVSKFPKGGNFFDILSSLNNQKKESPKKNNKKPLSKDEKVFKNKKEQRLYELDNLYKLIFNNQKDFFDKYPLKNVEDYFKKYTTKRISKVNSDKGSNIHGLVEDLQDIVQKNEFYKIAELSNDIKREFNSKNGQPYNKYLSEKADIEKIKEIDEKIPILHYEFAEDLLTNKAVENFANKKNFT